MELMEFLTSLLRVFSIVLAPILVIYAAIAWKGVKGSRMLPILVVLGVLLAIRSVTYYSYEIMGEQAAQFLGALALTLAMLLLLFSLRTYVHFKLENGEKEIKWVSKKKRK